ncbi:MAG: hypothetical protein KAY21_09905 [Limnohabitans sp.]|nr:hypothetical protein [Limnohabitans sp.]
MIEVFTRYRATDPDTSKAAANHAASAKAVAERLAIYRAIKAAPEGLTAREVATITGIDYFEVQRRKGGTRGIYETDDKRGGCKVWRAVE